VQWDSILGDSVCVSVCMMQWDSAVCNSEGVRVNDTVGQCSR
jgi:hypothetical protein